VHKVGSKAGRRAVDPGTASKLVAEGNALHDDLKAARGDALQKLKH
jgi:hypothetical protein